MLERPLNTLGFLNVHQKMVDRPNLIEGVINKVSVRETYPSGVLKLLHSEEAGLLIVKATLSEILIRPDFKGFSCSLFFCV